jgi:hypothetical protein
MFGHCLPGLARRGSDPRAGGRNHEARPGRRPCRGALLRPVSFQRRSEALGVGNSNVGRGFGLSSPDISQDLGVEDRLRKYKPFGASVDLAGWCMPVCGSGWCVAGMIRAAGASSSGHWLRDRRQARHGDDHETDQDGHDAKSTLDGYAVDFSDGSGSVRYGPSGT